MAKTYSLVDQWGRPIVRKELTREVAVPTLGGVRSPLSGYPGNGLDPARLATIMREADAGDPVRYMELAEQIEERFEQYLSVLGTRKRQVSQLEITVEPASTSPEHTRHADMVREWLDRDELSEELFDVLDAIGKGRSITEILWDTSEGEWKPSLAWRDPRWFGVDRVSLDRPTYRAEGGTERELPGGKFIIADIKAKSGLAVRGGLARPAAWLWMFSAFTQRDWSIFTQNFGMPVRIGKYGSGATEGDKETLFRAVAGIAGDMAAIIPDSMMIDFVEFKGLGASVDHYERRATFFNLQASKLVLGQTATTDSVTGGLGSGEEHGEVREDIERSDAKSLAGVLNRDLIRVWVMLQFGPQEKYPRISIGRAEQTDVSATVDAVARMVPLGLKVGQRQMRDVIGLGAPDEDDELLNSSAPNGPAAASTPPATPDDGEDATAEHEEDTPEDGPDEEALQQSRGRAAEEIIADAAAGTAVDDMVDELRALAADAGSLTAAIAALEARAAPESLTGAMRRAMLLAWLSGEAAEIDRDG